MPRNGSGLYVPPPANYPAVPATLIIAANRNAIDADIATALTNSIAVNGESVVTADIPFGNNKLTGVKDGTLAKDAANVSQIQNSNAILLATVSGTDTITASLSPALTAYANGQIFTLIPANTNTGAVTININGLGAKALTKNGSTALVAGDLVAGVEYSLQYDGTRFQKVAGSDYAKSGANSDITSLSGLTTPLSVAQGGLGVNSLTANSVVLGNGVGAPSFVAPGASGNVLTSNGTTWESAPAVAGASGFASGTRLAFNQSAAPTGWTKDTTATLNDSILRIVTGAVGSGGSTAFSAFNAQSSTAAHTLTAAQIPAHTHGVTGGVYGIQSGTAHFGSVGYGSYSMTPAAISVSASTGGDGVHSHGITTSIKYNDFIIASKD